MLSCLTSTYTINTVTKRRMLCYLLVNVPEEHLSGWGMLMKFAKFLNALFSAVTVISFPITRLCRETSKVRVYQFKPVLVEH